MFDRLDYRDYRSPVKSRQLTFVVVGFTLIITGYVLVRHADAFRSRRLSPLRTAEVDQANWHAPSPHILPPVYSAYHSAELRQPQQDWSRTQPAPHEKFFFVAGHTRGLGWGNAVQEHILNAYLAYKSGRSFVFGNFTWNDDGSVYSDYEGTGKMIPSQIPYSTLLHGPIVGDPFPRGDLAPRAVTKDYFDQLCPQKVDLDRSQIHATLSNPNSAQEMTEKWSTTLKGMQEPCVQASRGSGPIFSHHDIWGVRSALLEIWPNVVRSPMFTHFGWSPLVELAFDNNHDLYVPSSVAIPHLSSMSYTTNAQRYTPIPGLMVLHVRKGDYATHCRTLAMWSEDFVSVDAFPDMMDPFTVPPHTEYGNNTPENVEIYRKRCLPTIQEITAKVAQVRATSAAHGVRRLYIMTNGRPEYLRDLKDALWTLGGWEMIATSRDLVLNWEQKYVSQAVDMLIAQRAQILLGNGFSTLTSNAVMMRLANGFPRESTRFW